DGAGEPVFLNFLRPVFNPGMQVGERLASVSHHDHGGLLVAYFIAWLIAVAGGLLAAFLYLRFFPSREGQPAPAAATGIANFARNKFYVDELYDLVVIRPVRGISYLLYKIFDALFIDTVLVRG